ncbi:MAG: acetylxylan esterase [Bryobacterales bacterium]|nr:acetylxylan esterase [Bryobacterales bacterium]
MKILALASAVACLAALGQVPSEDARWRAVEGTRFAYPMPVYASRAEWEARKARLKKQILAAAGLLPMPRRGPVHAEIFSRLDRDGYSIEKVALETMPGYYLGGNLYRPRGKQGKFPGVLTPHGHWKHGRLENTDLGSIPGRSINLARQGYVVFAYDMVGYNDTKQTPHAFGSPEEQLWNFGPLSLQLWNSLRAADFLASLPDVDAGRLAATGASGGGTQTFLLAAVDDRIRADVPVNMVSGIMQGGSPCENAPGLRHDTFNVDFAAMMAPRPMLLVSATGDWTKNVPKIEYPAIRKVYELYGAASQVRVVQFDSPHNYHRGSREAMYTFFGKVLLAGNGDPVMEQPFTVEKDEDMLVWSGRAMPANALPGEDAVFAAWRRLTQVARPDREALRYALSVENPARVLSVRDGESITLSRPGREDRVPGIYLKGKGIPLLVVDSEGAAAARATVPANGRPVLYLDAWNTGAARGERYTAADHFYTFQRTDSQNRVQDILTALAWLRTTTKGPVELQGVSDGILWSAFAAAVYDGRARLADRPEAAGTDEDMLRGFFVPGIQRVGGLKAALALAR